MLKYFIKKNNLTFQNILQKTLLQIENDIASNKINNYIPKINPLQKPYTSPILKSYKEQIENEFEDPNRDILYRSRYSKIIGINKIDPIKIQQNIVYSDFLMFNKNHSINLFQVDSFLSHFKFKTGGLYNVKIDGWGWKYGNLLECNFSLEEYENMEFVITEEEKRLSVLGMLLIMNECEINDINLINYNVLSGWCQLHDKLLNSNISNLQIIKDIKKTNESKKNVCTSLIKFDKNLLNLCTDDEIIDSLYYYAIGGSLDLYNICEDTNFVDYELIKKSRKINEINGCKINVSLDKFDLEEYAKQNTISRANKVIEKLKTITKNRVNMKMYISKDGTPITKSKLILELYKLLNPNGKNVIQYYTNLNKLSPEETDKILYEFYSDYINYVNNVPFKLDLSKYPIIDYSIFDKINGDGKFKQALQSFTRI